MDFLWHLFNISQLDFSKLPKGIEKGYFTASVYYFVYRSLLEGATTTLHTSDRSFIKTRPGKTPSTDNILPMPPGFNEKFIEILKLDPILNEIVEQVSKNISGSVTSYKLNCPPGIHWSQLVMLDQGINARIKEGLSIVPFDIRTIMLIERTALEDFAFDLQEGRV